MRQGLANLQKFLLTDAIVEYNINFNAYNESESVDLDDMRFAMDYSEKSDPTLKLSNNEQGSKDVSFDQEPKHSSISTHSNIYEPYGNLLRRESCLEDLDKIHGKSSALLDEEKNNKQMINKYKDLLEKKQNMLLENKHLSDVIEADESNLKKEEFDNDDDLRYETKINDDKIASIDKSGDNDIAAESMMENLQSKEENSCHSNNSRSKDSGHKKFSDKTDAVSERYSNFLSQTERHINLETKAKTQQHNISWSNLKKSRRSLKTSRRLDSLNQPNSENRLLKKIVILDILHRR